MTPIRIPRLIAAIAVTNLANAISSQAEVIRFSDGYSSTQGANGWSYEYLADYQNRHTAPANYSQMAYHWKGYWYAGNGDGDRAQIDNASLFQNAGYDPLVTWTATAGYAQAVVANNLTVNSNGQCYLDYWDASAGTMTTLGTYDGGLHNESYTLYNVAPGDMLFFGKVANYGDNYASASWNPAITVPEPAALTGLVLLGGILAGRRRRCTALG